MADNFAVTAGSGTTIATDDIGGVNYQRVKLSLGADGTANDAVAGSGTNGTGVQRVTIATDDVMSAAIVGAAHDAADSGNPIKVGARAIAALSGTTLVSAADRTNAQSDLDGAMLFRENGAIGDYVSGYATNTDGAATSLIAAGAAGVKHYITDVCFANSSATAVLVELKDATTTKWACVVPAGGSVTHTFSTPLGGTAATAWNMDAGAATTTLYGSATGFKSKI